VLPFFKHRLREGGTQRTTRQRGESSCQRTASHDGRPVEPLPQGIPSAGELRPRQDQCQVRERTSSSCLPQVHQEDKPGNKVGRRRMRRLGNKRRITSRRINQGMARRKQQLGRLAVVLD
ncbi:unnamed protein product, partial [Musa acuminata subsp. burmannicoides]